MQISIQICSMILDHHVVVQTLELAWGQRENTWPELWGKVRTGSLSFWMTAVAYIRLNQSVCCRLRQSRTDEKQVFTSSLEFPAILHQFVGVHVFLHPSCHGKWEASSYRTVLTVSIYWSFQTLSGCVHSCGLRIWILPPAPPFLSAVSGCTQVNSEACWAA